MNFDIRSVSVIKFNLTNSLLEQKYEAMSLIIALLRAAFNLAVSSWYTFERYSSFMHSITRQQKKNST